MRKLPPKWRAKRKSRATVEKRPERAEAPPALTVEMVRDIVRAEVNGALSVLLHAMLMPIDAQWIKDVMDEQTSLYRALRTPTPKAPVEKAAAEPAESEWRPISEMPFDRKTVWLRDAQHLTWGGRTTEFSLMDAWGNAILWTPTEWKPLAAGTAGVLP